MPFNLFHKKKEPQQETPSMAPQTEPQPEGPAEPTPEVTPEPVTSPEASQTESEQQTPEESAAEAPSAEAPVEPQEPQPQAAAEPEEPVQEAVSKLYLKAMPLKELSDVASVESEVRNGNIIILRVTPLAGKSIEDVKTAVNELFQFSESIGGDIARLGEERVVICPKTVRIWREKTPAPVAKTQPLPTAA